MSINESLHRGIKTFGLNFKKASPDIAFAAGLILGGIAIFDFCKTTYDNAHVVTDFKSDIEEVTSKERDGSEDENKKAVRKEVVTASAKFAKEAAKVYWRPILIDAASVALLSYSHVEMKNRNTALAAISASLGAELRNLRERIKERYGEDIEKELASGLTRETLVDAESGESKEVLAAKDVASLGTVSPWSYVFDDKCRGVWKENPDYNEAFLKEVEDALTNRLNSDGYLSLAVAIDDALGIKLDADRYRQAYLAGWYYEPGIIKRVCLNAQKIYEDAGDGSGRTKVAYLLTPNIDTYYLLDKFPDHR